MRPSRHGLHRRHAVRRASWLPLIAALATAPGVHALVNIPNGANVAGVWTAVNSPYVIQGKATIAAGAILTIQPGVVVRFKVGDNFNYANAGFNAGILIVEGQLKALGQPNNIIQFTRDGNAGRWGMVFFKANAPSTMQFSKFSYAREVLNLPNNAGGARNFKGALSFAKNSGCNVTGCIFAENDWGIHAYRANWTVTGCTFVDNVTGGVLASYASPVIRSNVCKQSKEGIRCEYSSNPSITTNSIYDVTVGVACTYTSSPTLHNNEIDAVNFGLLAMFSCHPVVKGCVLTGANHGVFVETQSSCDVWNSTLYDNNTGVDVWDNSSATVLNSILWGGADLGFGGGGVNSATVKYSDLKNLVQPPQAILGVGNIFAQNPRFRDPANGDFHLMASECGYPHNSPCINRGNPDAGSNDACLGCDAGLWGARNDMGAYGGAWNCWLPLPAGRPEDIADCETSLGVEQPPLANDIRIRCAPNPFSESVAIRLDLPSDAHGTVRLYDITGRSIRTLHSGALPGERAHLFSWDGKDDCGVAVSRGLYVCVLAADGVRVAQPVVFTD
ncbi:MAG: right-handed parallel beta-helix repeat-containing protein [Candidatus Eisenbacteria bacterium]|nr:right-handed parallel beta-helix repeat-containing protein [Candidatus Eisenbacteria bacterium]